MRLFTFLLENARPTLLWLVLTGACAGLFSAGLLALITHALTHRETGSWLLFAGFSALVLGRIVSTLGSQLLLVRFSQGTILELSLRLSRKLLDAPLRLLEQRGGGRILATLTDDVSSVAWAVQCVPQLAMNLAVLVGCAVYLAWLAWLAWKVPQLRTLAASVSVLLAAQVTLGVSNILTGLNLAVAVGHNAGAALLLAALVVLNFALSARLR